MVDQEMEHVVEPGEFRLLIGTSSKDIRLREILTVIKPVADESYIWPSEPGVLNNLKLWQGYKFGIIIHFGLYSQLGDIESWGLCPEDWVERKGFDDYFAYATHYRNTKAIFNPVDFNPAKWAKTIHGSGARYVIFTTKHHDGFCLFDSQFTDFKTTDKGCPYSVNRNADLAKAAFDAFRNEGLAVGAYFSKPDWTTPYFWWPANPPKDRNPNYDITRHPDRWKKYVDYTRQQINEITSDYGKLDILWLDGCWVLPFSSITPKIAEYCKYPYDMDLDMKTIAQRARTKQPGMLVVDRWVGGPYENYLTPEQKIPEKALAIPWESCITMGNAWGWVPGDQYKPAKELIQLLVKIVAKGGNLLLGIGPNGAGEFEPAVYDRLSSMGKWLRENGEAIYGTVPVEPYQDGKIAYTAKGDQTIYAIYLPDPDEKEIPAQIGLLIDLPGKIKVSLLALNKRLQGKRLKDHLVISIPTGLRKSLAASEAVVIKISAESRSK
jgi:alpha-L-fucosidase